MNSTNQSEPKQVLSNTQTKGHFRFDLEFVYVQLEVGMRLYLFVFVSVTALEWRWPGGGLPTTTIHFSLSDTGAENVTGGTETTGAYPQRA